MGQQKPAIRIQIDPVKLASVGLSMEEVRAIVNTASTNAPKGAIEVGAKGYTIYSNDQLTTADGFNDVVLAFRNGAPVRVSDIGRALNPMQVETQDEGSAVMGIGHSLMEHLILDARGRPLQLPAERRACREAVTRWVTALNLY